MKLNIWMRSFEKLPHCLLLLTLLYILFMIGSSYLIDIRQVTMPLLTGWIKLDGESVPLFWFHIFGEASPTEMLQWAHLGLSAFLAGIYAVLQYRNSSRVPWAVIILFIGLVIMFAEDVYNLRHLTSDYIAQVYFGIEGFSSEWWASHWRSLIELTFYLFLGCIMLAAFLLIWKNEQLAPVGKKYLLAGYLFYGAAAAGSATRHLGSWYLKLGERILMVINEGMRDQVEASFQKENLGFYIMDYVVEESVELFGAVLITSALLVFIHRTSTATL